MTSTAKGSVPDPSNSPGMPPRNWDALRHKVVGRFFSPLFSNAGSHLCAPGQLPTRGIHRILVCRPNHRLGNAVLLSPLLAELETLYPGAEIDMISAGDAAQTLFATRFQIRRIVGLPRKIARHLWLTVRQLRQLRSDTYDLAIDACNGSQSGRLLLAIVNARYKVGFPDDSQHEVPPEWVGRISPPHLAQRNVFLLRTAYAGAIEREYPPLNVGLSASELQQAGCTLDAILGASGQTRTQSVVGIFANATGAKCYGETWWSEFLASLRTARPDLRIVDVLAEHGRSQLGERFPTYYTRDLRKLTGVIANMDAFISADCGVMHLAVASGTPTFGLFSVTDPVKYAPYGGHNMAFHTRDETATSTAARAGEWLDRAAPAK
ncbi:MAG: lipopolysaccharide heptosyltransferase family protein [Rhodanobacter sp.]|jgi:ADP-heptose:LPS heptosyltransferase|nr:lipopolysaccharide heptosyltransferase family protein [Rhodanobacter sp.]